MFWAEIWKISEFLSENFQFFMMKFSIYLNVCFRNVSLQSLFISRQKGWCVLSLAPFATNSFKPTFVKVLHAQMSTTKTDILLSNMTLPIIIQMFQISIQVVPFLKFYHTSVGVVGWCEGAVYLTSLGRPTDIGLQSGKACYPCSG